MNKIIRAVIYHRQVYFEKNKICWKLTLMACRGFPMRWSTGWDLLLLEGYCQDETYTSFPKRLKLAIVNNNHVGLQSICCLYQCEEEPHGMWNRKI